ncbi:hypothetical protein Tco_1395519 [Tanacetum coccineum]
MPINSAAQQVHNHEDLPVPSLIEIAEHEAPPIVTTFKEHTSPISLTEADEFNQEDSAELDGNTLLTPYDALDFSEAKLPNLSCFPIQYHSSRSFASDQCGIDAHLLKCIVVLTFH